jgi:hypothetical protein
MSTLKTNNVQVGQSVTATNNFTLYQPSSPDGTVRLGNGNSGSVTDVASFTSAGVFAFNSGFGSVATAYGCRAWVNFNGTGTPAIRASGNVSSITDNGVGDYTVNFTTAMPDANYSVVCTRQVGTNSIQSRIFGQNGNTNPAAGSVRTYSFYNGAGSDAAEDTAYAFVAIFR